MPSGFADYGFYRSTFKNASTVVLVAAADSGTKDNVIAPSNTNYRIYVQRIILSVFTDAAQTLTFQDDAGTPVVIAKSPASPGLGVEVVADFGPEGIGLTTAKNLDIVISAAGLGAQVSIEAYQRIPPGTAIAAAGTAF